MNADWLFDRIGVAEEWNGLARNAVAALDDARAALERADADALTDGDRTALADALVALAEARARLRVLDEGFLGDAEKLLSRVVREIGPSPRTAPVRRPAGPGPRVVTQHAQPLERR